MLRLREEEPLRQQPRRLHRHREQPGQHGAPTNSLPQTGSLPVGGVLVLANASATAAFKPAGTITSSIANFNGDNALTLEKSGVVVDRFGQLGVDPGTAWTGGGVGTQDQTLRRKAGITAGGADAGAAFDPSVQWDSLPVDTSDGLGAHTVN